MPKRVDLDALLRSLVAREVKAVLAPHMGLLARLQELLDEQSTAPDQGRALSTGRPRARRDGQKGRRPQREVAPPPAPEGKTLESDGSAEPVASPAPAPSSEAAAAPRSTSVAERIKPVIRRKAEAQALSSANEQGPSGPSVRFAEGQVVRVRDGGELVDAEVLALATSAGVALIKRLHDGKRVEVKSTEIHSIH